MKSVFIAVPCYTGAVEARCAESIIDNLRCLEKNGYSVKLFFHAGCCYISQSRNICVDAFLKSGFTDLVFVDHDLGFDGDAIFKIMAYDRDIILGAYPYRNNSGGYPLSVLPDPDYKYHTPKVDKITGLIEIEQGPTGLMRIQRYVFEKMMKENPGWESICGEPHGKLWTFFDTGMLMGDKRWWGEDTLFCQRWRKMGGRLWCYPNITFQHIGKTASDGNYHEMLKAQPRG